MGVPKALAVDLRWDGAHGIGRFSREVVSRLSYEIGVSGGPPPASALSTLWLAARVCCLRNTVFFSPGYIPPAASSIPYVFTVHDLNHIDVAANSSAAKRLFYATVIGPGCRKAARVLTDSEFSRQRIIDWSGVHESRVRVVQCGVGPEFCASGSVWQPGYRYLLYVGNRKPHKNIPRLLSAFAASGTARSVRLALTGTEDDATTRLAQSLGIRQSVVYLGNVPESDLPAVYRGADLLVFPSLYEGFGLPALEAMACGVPVVASNAAAVPEVAGDAARLVDPRSVDDIAGAILDVLERPEFREMLVTKGLRQARKFSWDAVGEKVTDVLNEVRC